MADEEIGDEEKRISVEQIVAVLKQAELGLAVTDFFAVSANTSKGLPRGRRSK